MFYDSSWNEPKLNKLYEIYSKLSWTRKN
jgi:hypothetical protein